VPAPPGPQPPSRIQIEDPRPRIDCGRYRAKAVVGDTYSVTARVFKDGADLLRAVVKYRRQGDADWRESEMTWIDKHVDGDTWAGSFPVDRQGVWEWTVEAWTDTFASWHSEVTRKVAAGEPDLSGELSEGRLLMEHYGVDPSFADSPERAIQPEVLAMAESHPARDDATRFDPPLEVYVDRERARFGAWYELFPRSWGGFAGVEKQLPRLAELGFDVLYLPPIHPIGVKNRKGRNNALDAGPDDPGSPWAIGHHELGGHEAIHPDLGSFDDFERLCRAANEHGIEVCLDFAIQCSADHPWLTEHPEWFNRRPDGTLKYAENPPKKYQDIYNVNWDSEDWRGLWEALLEIVLGWVRRGVTIFRVDNPHTKPTPFWEWLIAEVRAEHPDVLFLAEAFTRRAKMQTLAKAGFNQSYTYFTWKNARWELMEYIVELAYSDERHYFRPNFFVNTPDILTEYLQHGGRPAFEARLVLGATLSPTYGVYSGYEHAENVPVRPGSEEYLDSEKYEAKRRALDGPLLPLIQRVNQVRRANVALQSLDNVTFLDTGGNEALIGYAKRSWDNIVITIVNIDPQNSQEGVVVVPAELGLPPAFGVADQLSGDSFTWHLGRNYVRLEPGKSHLLVVNQ
jgi:starch synthase (maltosyl-transferring)